MSFIHRAVRAMVPAGLTAWDRNLGAGRRLNIQRLQIDRQVFRAASAVVRLVSQEGGAQLRHEAILRQLAVWRLQEVKPAADFAPVLVGIGGEIMQADGIAAPHEITERHRIKAKDAIVWIFDDQEFMVDCLEEALRDMGFNNIKKFTDPRDWNKQGTEIPHLVLTDMNMGVIGLNGRNLIDAMHEQYSTKRPKFVLICAPENPENIKDKDYLEAQRDTKFFRKPMSLSQIEEHLHALFDFEA